MVYAYDNDAPATHETKNNRLVRAELWAGAPLALVETIWYAYNRGGQVKWTVAEQAAAPGVYAVRSYQYDMGQRMWLYRTFTWDDTGPTPAITPDSAWEFRYAGGRQRYLVRKRDFANGFTPLDDETYWYEYAGDQIYQDLHIDPVTLAATPTARYIHAGGPGGPGASPGGVGVSPALADGALVALDGGPGYTLGDRRFFHADMLGTTRLLTGAGGSVAQSLAYTAFGEPLADAQNPQPARTPRYGYAGAWGYQADAIDDAGVPQIGTSAFPFEQMHVGARYYQPAAGRFMGRDPIGILGGMNVHTYADGRPTIFVDPHGLTSVAESASVSGIQAQIVAVSAQTATNSAARGGIKLTITLVEQSTGRQFVFDGIATRLGNAVTRLCHFKGPPPYPPTPLGF